MNKIIVWLTMPTSVMITTNKESPTKKEIIATLQEQTSLYNSKYSKLIGYSQLTKEDLQKHPFFLGNKLNNV